MILKDHTFGRRRRLLTSRELEAQRQRLHNPRMAKVIDEGSELRLILSPLERLGALHGSMLLPKSALVRSYVMDTPWDRKVGMIGVRAPGTGIPWLIMLGTLRGRGFKDFAAVYGKGSATVYEFKGQEFRRWIVT